MTERSSEAGVYHVEDFVLFPPESGRPDAVVVKTEFSNWDEQKEDYVVHTVDEQVYRWTHSAFVNEEEEYMENQFKDEN